MTLETITVHAGGHPREAVLATLGDGPTPGRRVIHDITGFRRDTRRHCERFADEGYVAIAPDLYAGGRAACVVQTLLSSARNKGPAFDVIAQARRILAQRDDVDAKRIGVIGFCMGGGFALIAAADDEYAVAAPFYGPVPNEAKRLKGICPTLAQYGDRDIAFVSHAGRLERHLQTLGVEHEVVVHSGVGHSFMNDHHDPLMRVAPHLPPLHAGYDASTEADAWDRVLEFFERHMAG